MADSNIENSKELVDAISNLVVRLQSFPFALEIVYLISGVVVFSFVYIMTKIILEYKKNSEFNRLLEKNTTIIGECKEVMRHVYNALERL